MSEIRCITTALFGNAADKAAATAAPALAKRLGAHVIGVFVHPDPDTLPMLYGEGVSADLMRQIQEARREDFAHRHQQASKLFWAACAEHNIPQANALDGDIAAASWREVLGDARELLPEEAHASDLVVFGRTGEVVEREALEATLLTGGRPVLLTDRSLPTSFRTVAVAWTASDQAARALAVGLPFCQRAGAVYLLHVDEGKGHTTRPAEEYLRRHGIKAETRLIARNGASSGAALLDEVNQLGADLLIMGGYGHSRTREFVFGGVTREALEEAEVPLLLMH